MPAFKPLKQSGTNGLRCLASRMTLCQAIQFDFCSAVASPSGRQGSSFCRSRGAAALLRQQLQRAISGPPARFPCRCRLIERRIVGSHAHAHRRCRYISTGCQCKRCARVARAARSGPRSTVGCTMPSVLSLRTRWCIGASRCRQPETDVAPARRPDGGHRLHERRSRCRASCRPTPLARCPRRASRSDTDT